MMRFNHDARAFEFYEMSFENGRPKLSEPNPRKCLECHQSAARRGVDPQRTWEPYNTWPGFYGSLDDDTDLFKNGYYTQKEYRENGDLLMLEEFEVESSRFYDFTVNTYPNHPRYSLLSLDTRDQYGKAGTTLNGDLTNRLAVLNFQRVARLIRTENPSLYEKVNGRCGRMRIVRRTCSCRKRRTIGSTNR